MSRLIPLMPSSKLLALVGLVLSLYALGSWRLTQIRSQFPVGQCIYNFVKHQQRNLDPHQGTPSLVVKIDKISWHKTSFFEYDPQCWLAPNYFRGSPCWKQKSRLTFMAQAFNDYTSIPECPLATDHYLDTVIEEL